MTAQTQPAQPKTPGFAADGKTPIYSIVGVGIVVRADEFNRLHAENEQLRSAMNIPTIEKGSKDWLSSDPAIAWHQIDRYADNWADIGLMMQEYIDAQKQSAVQRLEARIAELREMLLKECQHSADQKLRADQMTEQHRMQAAMNSEARAKLAQLRESKPLSDEQALAIVHNFCLNVGDWDRNGLSVLRATEAAHGIGEKTP